MNLKIQKQGSLMSDPRHKSDLKEAELCLCLGEMREIIFRFSYKNFLNLCDISNIPTSISTGLMEFRRNKIIHSELRSKHRNKRFSLDHKETSFAFELASGYVYIKETTENQLADFFRLYCKEESNVLILINAIKEIPNLFNYEEEVISYKMKEVSLPFHDFEFEKNKIILSKNPLIVIDGEELSILKTNVFDYVMEFGSYIVEEPATHVIGDLEDIEETIDACRVFDGSQLSYSSRGDMDTLYYITKKILKNFSFHYN